MKDSNGNRVDSMGEALPVETQLISALQEAHDLRKALEFALRFGLSFVNIRGTDVWYVHGGQPGPLREMPAEIHGVMEAARLAIRSTVDGTCDDGK